MGVPPRSTGSTQADIILTRLMRRVLFPDVTILILWC
jgi:hypothetical protein